MLVGEGAEGVGAEVDEGLHVLGGESGGGCYPVSVAAFDERLLGEVLTNFALVVHGVVVVFVVFPASLADGLVGHFLSVLALFLLLFLELSGFAGFMFAGFMFAGFRFAGFRFAGFRFAGFRPALGHGALLAGLAGAFVGRLAGLLTLLAETLLALLAETLLALLAWVLRVLLVLLVLSIAVLVLLTVWIFALLLLLIALVVLLGVALALNLLAVIILAALLTVLLLLTVLRHSFGKLRLDDQVTS